MLTTTWQRQGDALRCARHGATFASTSTCPGCDVDPPPQDDDDEEPLPAPPPGCKSSLELEQQLAAEVETVRKMAREASAMDQRTRWSVADADRLWNTYLKGTRQLIGLAARREDAEMVRRYERRLRARGVSH